MHITSSQPLASPQPKPVAKETKSFNNNVQDPDTLSNDTISLGVNASNGEVSTDSVILDNKKAVFVFGQLVGLRDDPKYKLEPNADGNFVFEQNHPSFTGANAFGAAAATVNKYNEVLGELTGKKIEWAFGKEQLKVSPETGEWPNAFYARQFEGVHFFDVKHTSTGDSGEVASHEVGHAVLDALRPGYLGATGPESGAFHEAFGDVLAMLMTLGSDKAVDAIVAQTEAGDLSSKRNMLSDMGEGFGAAIGLTGGIRTSFNKFTYKDPATLPERGDENNLGHEVHDFSRLWSGAFYDILDGIADAHRDAGMSPQAALKAAGEEGWKLLVGQMEKSSASSETTFKEMATALLAGDAVYNNGERQELIKDVMTRRELMVPGQELFKSFSAAFSGQAVEEKITLGDDFGALAGVKLSTQVDRPLFGFAAAESFESSSVAAEAQKGVKLMMQGDKILFTDKEPEFAELFKPDGTMYKAYVAPNAEGERELTKVPIAFCNFTNGPDAIHDHGHGHSHSHHGHICNH